MNGVVSVAQSTPTWRPGECEGELMIQYSNSDEFERDRCIFLKSNNVKLIFVINKTKEPDFR